MSKKVASKKKAAAKKTAARKGTAGKKAASKKKAASRKGKADQEDVGGRPSKYTDDMPERLLEFFRKESAYEVKVDPDSGKQTMQPTRFPTLARFAAENGVCRDTLHHWATEKDDDGHLVRPHFSDAYKVVKEFQEALLVEGAMAGAYQQTFSIFAAKNILGWRDQQDLSHTTPDGSMTPNVNIYVPDNGRDG